MTNANASPANNADAATAKTTPVKLPPGMVLGPDGKPCKACSSGAAFRSWKPPGYKAAGAAAAAVGTAASTNTASAQCPPDKEQLGRATWSFLHTTAAYYPERPTPSQRANMLALIHALPVLYPCSHCAEDFGESVARNKPDVSGRAGLSRWFCERHNEVNEKLGKEPFDCAKTGERWKEGPADGSCN
ncbi:ERV/ALR sulfhydryl oxidase domain-containing protein [Roridomyces roridus]|uniref:Sulfhydryl oxidase n=1 Tax=Roridomyces roridus TaxID=1738132 RepID=A0AAD7FKR1_9AGAR|nr:ERV/ALR sulfhydryl oxidase domain-containing protein [Roridomyces roridus]